MCKINLAVNCPFDNSNKAKKEKAGNLIDVEVPAAKNVPVVEFEKLFIYEDLEIEVKNIWFKKTVTIPVVIPGLRLLKKGIKNI